MTWLLDTLVWTGALIAGVLLVRRPIARHLGAKAAYALWSLPLLRMALPPIVLPGWLGPARVPVSTVAAAPADATLLLLAPPSAATAVEPGIDWATVAIAVWLMGGAAYVVLRLLSYFALRRSLLAEARAVGDAGKIRLVETPATASPLAFGVLDKVVALPPGLMASSDRRARDLALAHELAHHRAHDLLFNFLALPLFALHWFNPLSVLGWRAMRRDQEAACDARVVERCDRRDRAAYAVLIASAVAGPRGALAAPMACPVLGDKSIVHRLRSLTMIHPSTRQRRLGALLLGASVLLVPLTASVSYAQDETAAVPDVPQPPAAPLAPRAPDAPLAAVEPTPPPPPAAPLSPEANGSTYVIHRAAPEGTREHRRVIVVRDKEQRDGKAPLVIDKEYRVVRLGQDARLDDKSVRELEALAERLGRLGEDLPRSMAIPREQIERLTRDLPRSTRLAIATAPSAPAVMMDCDGENSASDTTDANGKRTIRICRHKIQGGALAGLRSARAQIARQREMSDEVRKDVLERLDREIERLEAAK